MEPLLARGLVVTTAILCVAAIGAGHPTTDSGQPTLVVDRLVEERAVILVEADGETVTRRHVTLDSLPDGAGTEGVVLRQTAGGYAVDRSATAERTASAERQLDRLSRDLPREPDTAAAEMVSPSGIRCEGRRPRRGSLPACGGPQFVSARRGPSRGAHSVRASHAREGI